VRRCLDEPPTAHVNPYHGQWRAHPGVAGMTDWGDRPRRAARTLRGRLVPTTETSSEDDFGPIAERA
jgi:hypothetical protein